MLGDMATDLAYRQAPVQNMAINGVSKQVEETSRQKHSRSSYTESSPLTSRNNSLVFRPAKRPMSTPKQTIAVINASGRQAESLIRIVTAVGYKVRAQMRNSYGVIAREINDNPLVEVLEGELYTKQQHKADVDVTKDGPALSGSGIGVNHDLIKRLFRGCQLAFINTTFYGDEIKIGQALADAAKEVGIQHYIYSSMPDHSTYNKGWPSLPLWAPKQQVEDYVTKIGLPATFVYTGIYNNNFTSQPYPLFCMELQKDGSFLWRAPFHPDAKLPWLDAEHDIGPAILQIFKDGVGKWGNGKRIALAFESLTPLEVCEAFERGLGRKVRYERCAIQVKVAIPDGYRSQLDGLSKFYDLSIKDPKKQSPYFGDMELENDYPTIAMELWEGPRQMEEYAREVFPLEEQANGLSWMLEDGETVDLPAPGARSSTNGTAAPTAVDDDEDDDEEDGLVMKGPGRKEQGWLT